MASIVRDSDKRCKLTERNLTRMKNLRALGWSIPELAKCFSVHTSTIRYHLYPDKRGKRDGKQNHNV